MDDLTILTEFERKELRKVRTIFLSGDVDSSTSHDFVQDMQMLLTDESIEPIKVIISSPGGDVFAGLTIIRAIEIAKSKGIKVVGEVAGHACSMAFFVLQSCDERIMGKFDILMAHGVTTGFRGDMKNMKSETKLLNYWHAQFAEMIANRCIGEWSDSEFWMSVLEDNTPQWYTAEESKEMGLVDRVDGNDKNKETE